MEIDEDHELKLALGQYDEVYLAIAATVDNWFDKFDRQFMGSKEVQQLKAALYANISQYKDLP